MDELLQQTAALLKIPAANVESVLKLRADGNTVPFIARYRKEVTGGLDEEQIRAIEEDYNYRVNLKQRKEDVYRLIEAQGKMTPEIADALKQAVKLSQVDDIYRPYQQKRKTRASEARRKGLEPLAQYLTSMPASGDPVQVAAEYLNEEVKTPQDALQGAMDILAEQISDNPGLRELIRSLIHDRGELITQLKKNASDEKMVYKLYYDHKESVKKIEAHRVMAIDRAEKENVITVSFSYPTSFVEFKAVNLLTGNKKGVTMPYIQQAVQDGLKRLAFPALEREVRNDLSEKAAEKSIRVFTGNVEKLLLQAPIKGRYVLGFDPAYRTGCKLAVLDPTGKMLEIAKIYPHQPHNKKAEAERTILALLRKYPIKIVAIGNGTASRESESFMADVISKNHLDVAYTLVSEAGASVYSASEIAREEFPDLSVEERSAASIGRRIQDPLAELIKIDPESIGVGQYQHDLPKKQLRERLDFVTEKAVNRVGVDVNTASRELLEHVSGFNRTIAANVVSYRNSNGEFSERKELLNVPKLGPKAYQQAVGFLRIRDGKEPLDATSIHPESYDMAHKIWQMAGNSPLGSPELKEALKTLTIDPEDYTSRDIASALAEPLRDYRDNYAGPLLRNDILEIKDLKDGDVLEGVVRNVVDFGAFVDIGLHEDGLVHRSKMGQARNVDPNTVLSVGDIIKVRVLEVDVPREKVSLELVKN